MKRLCALVALLGSVAMASSQAEVPTTSPAQEPPKLTTETVRGMEVRGTREFIERVREALDLLARSQNFWIARPYLKAIHMHERSGMNVFAEKPTFQVGERTWRHSAIWLAGAIAHDAYHSLLYFRAKRRAGGAEPVLTAWAGQEAERQCLRFQVRVLRELRAPQEMIAYVQSLIAQPTYQGDPGSAEDYLRRNW